MVNLGAVANWTHSAGVGNAGESGPEAKKTIDAAKQFETLLIGQMLKTMRESGSGWLGSDEDQAGESAMGMAEEHFAAALSAGGGFGLAATVERGLTSASQARQAQKLQD